MHDEDMNTIKPKNLTLDVDFYQSFLDDKNIPEDRKRELIETLWSIVVSFVDLGFGIHPLQQVNDGNSITNHPAISKMISEVANEHFNQTKEIASEREDA